MLKRSLFFVFLLSSGASLHAQAVATASRAGDAQIGIGYSIANPDYSPHHFTGIAAYADFDFSQHLGVEGEFHFDKTSSTNPGDKETYEKTYEIGPRYFRTYGRLSPYAKIMYGRGIFNFPYTKVTDPTTHAVTYQPNANLAYNMFAAGFGADFRVKRFLNVRADYEFQRWLGFVNSSLSPSVLTIGVAYHFE